MTTMQDLNKLSPKDLIKTLKDKQEALKDFRFGNTGSKSRNVKEGRGLRKDIARIMMILSTQARTNDEAKA